jgi:hypothetical protein
MKTIYAHFLGCEPISTIITIETHTGQKFLGVENDGMHGAVLLSMEDTDMPIRPLEIRCYKCGEELPANLNAEFNYVGSIRLGSLRLYNYFAERK